MDYKIFNDMFYGCYEANHSKRYKWQCKNFETFQEATEYTIDPSNKDKRICGLTALICIKKIFPNILHKPIIKYNLISSKIDIV
jgi:hypothetical protein